MRKLKLSFLRSKSFLVRTLVAVVLIGIAVVGFMTPNAALLRVAYLFGAGLAIAEIKAFAIDFCPSVIKEEKDWWVVPAMEAVIVAFSALAMCELSPKMILLVIVTACGSDIIAYLVGNVLGGRLIKLRPFPTVSPKKTWEGLIAGVVLVVPIAMVLNTQLETVPREEYAGLVVSCCGGVVAVVGDVIESAIKRDCGVKDSCDALRYCEGYRLVEQLLGGREGHGGYLDRIDSLSWTLSIAYLASFLHPNL